MQKIDENIFYPAFAFLYYFRYFYDDPEYYRKYRASYPGYFELGVKGSRSRLLEDIYLSDR